MTDFLAYWKPDQIALALRSRSLAHAASNQFTRVSRGDRVWICGRRDGQPDLLVIGFIDVASILGAKEAQAEMRRRVPHYRVWDADAHILAKRGSECATRPVSLKPIYRTVEFDSKGSRKLKLSRGQPAGQQLQTMRKLTRESAVLIAELWESVVPSPIQRPTSIEPSIDLDELDARRIILARLEQQAARSIVLEGRATAPCVFCGRDLPASLLIAAHIKPRASCTDAEKRMIKANVIPLCRLGCDDLFELGYVEVFDGVVVSGSATPKTKSVNDCVSRIANRRVLDWTLQRENYFRWRRENRPSPAT